MINQSTTDKLIEMRLTAMADAFRIQMDDSSMKDISFEDRFGMLVDVEYMFFATPKYLKLQNAFPKVAAGNSSFLHVSPA